MPAPTATTLIDRVDSHNNVIGTVVRGDVFRENANFRTVHVVLTNSAGCVLVQQLAASRARNPGLWGTSVAGYLLAGEEYAAAAARRTREELGVSPGLTAVGVLPMVDDGVTKFIGVFTGRSDSPRIADPDHTSALEFRSVPVLVAELKSGLSTYTESFRHVFQYWMTMNGS